VSATPPLVATPSAALDGNAPALLDEDGDSALASADENVDDWPVDAVDPDALAACATKALWRPDISVRICSTLATAPV
jgi:hypothetical protein